MEKMKLEVGCCYKHIPSGEVYIIRSIGKEYAHSRTGKLSPNVMRVLMEPVLRHGALLKEQVRYMESGHWQRLGILRQERINGRSVDYNHSARDYSIPIGEAKAALEEVSSYFRKIGKIDLAFKMDEISEDYVGIVAKPKIKYKGSLVDPLNHQVQTRES